MDYSYVNLKGNERKSLYSFILENYMYLHRRNRIVILIKNFVFLLQQMLLETTFFISLFRKNGKLTTSCNYSAPMVNIFFFDMEKKENLSCFNILPTSVDLFCRKRTCIILQSVLRVGYPLRSAEKRISCIEFDRVQYKRFDSPAQTVPVNNVE